MTIPNKDNEVGFVAEQYPGVGSPPEATYLEGLLIGHRCCCVVRRVSSILYPLMYIA